MVSKIPRRHRSCSTCSKTFASGERLTSVLSLSLDEEYVRADFCQKCWKQEKSDEELQGVWQCQIPIPPPLQNENAAEDSRLMALFLDSLEDPFKAYVLALYLVRRGILVRVRHPSGPRARMLLFEVKATGECVEVAQLSAQEAAQVQVSDIV